MAHRMTLWIMPILVIGFSGCARLLAPNGPMNYQQSRAVINDPFPQDDIGPSDATMRPPGFEQPLPEPVRGRLAHDSMPWVLSPDRQ